MHHHLTSRVWLAGWMIVILLAAGCFQPAGAGLEATTSLDALPTDTLMPTETETPLPPPTEIPTEIILDAPTFESFEVGTSVADAGLQEIDPFFQTATASFAEGQPIPIEPLQQDIQIQPLDPLLQTATQMVYEATATAALPLTLTAAPIFIPTPTNLIFEPTLIPSGPILTGSDCVYEVQPNDSNLYRISLLFGIPYANIAQSSGLVNPNIIHVGDKLIIPGCGTTGYIPPATTIPSDPGNPGNPPPIGSGQVYVVQQNDTLFALSLQWGTTVNVIASLNGIQNINLIYIGQELYIP